MPKENIWKLVTYDMLKAYNEISMWRFEGPGKNLYHVDLEIDSVDNSNVTMEFSNLEDAVNCYDAICRAQNIT